MTLNRRHLFAAAGGLAATATLAACGSNSGGLGASSSAPTTGGSSASNVALSQWYHEYGEAGVKEAVEKYAAEYTQAKVTVSWNPGEYAKKLGAALLTNDVPDVFESEQGASLDMIKQGQVADLTDIMAPVVSQFNPAVIKRFTFDGKFYAVPQVVDMQLLYYRKSVLEKAGVQPPKTFAELVDVANKVATGDMGGFFAGNDGGVGVLGTMFIWASGLEQFDEGRTKATFLEPAFYDALKAYRDFSKTKGLLQSASKEWYDGSAFANGETAMQWGGLWSMPDIQKAVGDDFGVVPFPAIGGSGRAAVPFGAFGSCVAAKGKNVDAAKAFVKWLWIDQEDKQVEFADAFGTHIPSKTALVAKASKLKDGAGADAAKFASENGFTNDIMWTGPLGDAYGAAVTKVIKQNADPAAEFKSVGELAATELKRVKG
ncbi:ABC transporter substrate-binding protein [Propionibacteriaceae bacterium G1746]|uniref:ABC transporter substrate-binding protein n=1 Tax=Aestuariimicrobium sp. G57 TaxID=3418485 RepID=UPI003C2200E9